MSKVITYDEFKKHQTRENFYLLIHNKIYDVSAFLDEHPGGDEILLAEAGKDASGPFDDVSHSDDAKKLVTEMLVGTFVGGEELKKNQALPAAAKKPQPTPAASASSSDSAMVYLIPVAVLVAYLLYRMFLS